MRWQSALIALFLALAPISAQAQQWPNGPIRIIVPYPAASAGDIGIRKLGPLMQAELGVPVVVENRTGGNGNIGMEAVAIAQPDGQTLVLGTDINFAVHPATGVQIPFDPDKSFATIGPMMSAGMIVAAWPGLKVKTMQELAALAKAKPDEYAYGSVGIGSQHHLVAEYLKAKGGFNMLHVPYRGTSQAIPDLISGKIHFMAMGLAQSIAHFRDGRLTPLAWGLSERHPDLPNLPTLSESGFPGFEARTIWGLWAPAGTPKPILERINTAMKKALQDKSVQEFFVSSGYTTLPDTPEQFDKRMRDDRQMWADLVKSAGIKMQE
jgi:tripartite-type tricarboxylate transporter receptor subunit TctC